MSYSNSYYSTVSKTQFERPTIPPILKMAQQHQQHLNSSTNNIKHNIYLNNNNNINNNHHKTKLNSILSLNAVDAEKKFLRQKKLLEEQIFANSSELVKASSDNCFIRDLKEERNANLGTKPYSSLATAFPGFYLNPNETNYVKLINSILNSKLKPSIKLPDPIRKDCTETSSSATAAAITAAASTQSANCEYLDKLRSNSCVNMNSIYEDEESSNMLFDGQTSSLSMLGFNSRSKTDFDLKKKPLSHHHHHHHHTKSSKQAKNNTNNNSSSKKNDMNYRLSNSYKNGLSKKFFVSFILFKPVS